MKHVVLQRAWSDHRATLGMMTVVGEKHDPIFTLENPFREKLFDSRIPDGQYECEPFSGVKFKDVFLVKNVPERTDILIHCGNFERDTLGCILVGIEARMWPSNEPMVGNSRMAMERLRALIGDEPFLLIISPEIAYVKAPVDLLSAG